MLVNNKIISNFSEKVNLFHKFFAFQCTPLENNSSLPPSCLKTDRSLSSLEPNIFPIIKNLDPNKSHGWDNLSIRMIELCGKSITYPLKLIFEASLQEGTFPSCWKKANAVLVHKKEDKNLLKNYRPISLLPIFGKIFERILFKDLFNCFHKNQLFTKCQSGFLPGDSWISQLLSTIHDINSSFDCDPTIDVSGVFLDISKAFDKVWHDGIIFKLETYAHTRFQMVVLNGQISTWELAKSGVSQRFVLGSLMFLIYINDLPDNIQSTCRIFADRTSLFSHVFNKDTSQDELNHDLQKVSDWVFQWKMQFNRDPIMIQLIQMQFSCDPNKQAKEVISSKKAECNNSFPLPFNKTEVETCQSQKHLGLILDKRLNFTEHINSKIRKCDKLIGIIKNLSISVPRNALLRFYKSFIRPDLDYAHIIYDKPNNASLKTK